MGKCSLEGKKQGRIYLLGRSDQAEKPASDCQQHAVFDLALGTGKAPCLKNFGIKPQGPEQ
jgi:hypothetical protein